MTGQNKKSPRMDHAAACLLGGFLYQIFSTVHDRNSTVPKAPFYQSNFHFTIDYFLNFRN